jgi:hypothetical protein
MINDATIRRRLVQERDSVGATSPLGRLYSTLIEQYDNYQKEPDIRARAHLKRQMEVSITTINASGRR